MYIQVIKNWYFFIQFIIKNILHTYIFAFKCETNSYVHFSFIMKVFFTWKLSYMRLLLVNTSNKECFKMLFYKTKIETKGRKSFNFI